MSKNKLGYSETFDETFGTILPSYMMYTSTLGMNAHVPETSEDDNLPPPKYDAGHSDCSHSEHSSNLLAATASTPATAASTTRPPSELALQSTSSSTNVAGSVADSGNAALIVTDEHSWKETILDNVHKLPNFTFEDHEIPKAVEIKIYYTKEVGEVGKEPEMIDPSLYEYKQGDLLNGYITIENKSNYIVPFEMFYLLFEGNFMIADSSDSKNPVPVKIQRFLEMFDFYGSFSEAPVRRFRSESGCDSRSPCSLIDPLDGTQLCFTVRKEILPNTTYKRFFSFRIPNNLLDTVCNDHNLSKHLQLPPTMGLSRWETAHFPEREQDKIKDFSMLHTSVSYGVMARFIGRKSTWEKAFGKFETPKKKDSTKLVNCQGDEYIILKELTNYVRVIAETEQPTASEKLMKQVENKLLFENMVNRLDAKIEHGKRLMEAIETNQFDDAVELNERLSQAEIDCAKATQSYKCDVDSIRDLKSNLKKMEYYKDVVPLIKRSLTGTRNTGVLQMQTPKQEYHINYIPPPRFREGSIEALAPSWHLNIPVELLATSTGEKTFKPPSIRDVTAELVVHTIRSNNKPIALEFNHDLVYNKAKDNHRGFLDHDVFKHNIIKPFQSRANELFNILKALGPENFKIEKSLVDDLKSICQLEEKKMNLVVEGLKVNNKHFSARDLVWKVKQTLASPSSSSSMQASTTMDVSLDLTKTSLKGFASANWRSFDRFNFVPNFQSCYMARFYHISLKITLSNGDCSRVKVPLFIDKI
ncbi:uncharacterized protein LODBEIA_P14090 [Lodderomyces beijingensis]|uniref:Bul1 N-terminal domain-containing protein n=1 Tax=Lodderomyces beijingensis TaxID=1775926 RepID=A0ABP0ZLM7_9ASCO